MVQEVQLSKKEINITYETIFDLLVREKNRDELQKLSSTYFNDIVVYLQEKEKAMNSVNREDARRAEQQLENAKRLIKELYDRREKKVVFMALNGARINETKANHEAFLELEKKLYNGLVTFLISARQDVLDKTLNKTIPEQSTVIISQQENKIEKISETKPETKPETKQVKLNISLSKFVDEKLQAFGPYNAGEIVVLPHKIANVLVSAGKASEV